MLVIEPLHIFCSLGKSFRRIFLNLLKMSDEVFHRLDRSVDAGKRSDVGVVTIISEEGSGFEGLVVAIIESELYHR